MLPKGGHVLRQAKSIGMYRTVQVFVRPFLRALAGHTRVARRVIPAISRDVMDVPAPLVYFQRAGPNSKQLERYQPITSISNAGKVKAPSCASVCAMQTMAMIRAAGDSVMASGAHQDLCGAAGRLEHDPGLSLFQLAVDLRDLLLQAEFPIAVVGTFLQYESLYHAAQRIRTEFGEVDLQAGFAFARAAVPLVLVAQGSGNLVDVSFGRQVGLGL